MATRYEIGTGVWLHSPQRKKGRSPKLSRNWDGSYVVVKDINDVVVRMKRSRQAKSKVVHINRLKPYTDRESFDWFVDERSGDERPLNELNNSATERNVESTSPSVKTTSNKDSDKKNQKSDGMVKSLRHGERTRKQAQRYTP